VDSVTLSTLRLDEGCGTRLATIMSPVQPAITTADPGAIIRLSECSGFTAATVAMLAPAAAAHHLDTQLPVSAPLL